MWSRVTVAMSEYTGASANTESHSKQGLVFKTLSLLLLLMAVLTQSSPLGEITVWVSLGLAASMVAGVFYFLGNHQRMAFLGFLCAQALYSKAFWLQLEGEIVWWLPALLLASGVVAFFLLLPRIDRLIFPVVIMGMTLVQLSWAAGEVWLSNHELFALLGFIGTLSFTVAAVLTALNDYYRALPHGRMLISGFYLLAHLLIVFSALA